MSEGSSQHLENFSKFYSCLREVLLMSVGSSWHLEKFSKKFFSEKIFFPDVLGNSKQKKFFGEKIFFWDLENFSKKFSKNFFFRKNTNKIQNELQGRRGP